MNDLNKIYNPPSTARTLPIEVAVISIEAKGNIQVAPEREENNKFREWQRKLLLTHLVDEEKLLDEKIHEKWVISRATARMGDSTDPTDPTNSTDPTELADSSKTATNIRVLITDIYH